MNIGILGPLQKYSLFLDVKHLSLSFESLSFKQLYARVDFMSLHVTASDIFRYEGAL